MRHRLATPDDVAVLAGLRAAEWGTEEYWRERIDGYLRRTHHPREALPERAMYVADDEARGIAVVGFVAGHLTRRLGCSGELQWINVASEHRRAGVAAELLRTIGSWFAGRGALRVCVDPDEGARDFYLKMGARAIDDHWLMWEDIRRAGEG
jgi:GNAT superfamily N-acetyltransferase